MKTRSNPVNSAGKYEVTVLKMLSVYAVVFILSIFLWDGVVRPVPRF